MLFFRGSTILAQPLGGPQGGLKRQAKPLIIKFTPFGARLSVYSSAHFNIWQGCSVLGCAFLSRAACAWRTVGWGGDVVGGGRVGRVGVWVVEWLQIVETVGLLKIVVCGFF